MIIPDAFKNQRPLRIIFLNLHLAHDSSRNYQCLVLSDIGCKKAKDCLYGFVRALLKEQVWSIKGDVLCAVQSHLQFLLAMLPEDAISPPRKA